MNNYFTIFIVILIFLLLTLSYSYQFTRVFSQYICILLFIICLWINPINLKLKISITIFLLYYYSNNIYLVTIFAKNMYNILNIENKNDIMTKNLILESYKSVLNVKTDLSKFSEIDYPRIIACNYVNDQIENVFCLSSIDENQKTSFVMDIILKNYIGFGRCVENPIFIPHEKNQGIRYEKLKEDIPKHINEGRNVFIYITPVPNSFQEEYEISKVNTGIFRLASELEIPISIICIDYIKRDYFGSIYRQNFHICAGETFEVNKENIRDICNKTKKFYEEKLLEFENKKFDII